MSLNFKRTFPPKMKILSTCIHLHLIPNYMYCTFFLLQKIFLKNSGKQSVLVG